MISNPNEAPATLTKTVLKESCPNLNFNMAPKTDEISKLPSDTRATKDANDAEHHDENKEEDATGTETTSLMNEESSIIDMNSLAENQLPDATENDPPNTVKLVQDANLDQHEDQETQAIQDDNVAQLNISMIQEDDDVEVNMDEIAKQEDASNMAQLNTSKAEEDDEGHLKNGITKDQISKQQQQLGEEYDDALHNLDDFDLYKLDYESDYDQDGGLENLQSPVRPKKKSSNDDATDWPNAAGGEILKPGDHVYMWCTVYQHHGIVLSTEPKADPPHVLIAEFTNLALAQANTMVISASAASGATVGSGATGAYRFVKETETTKWHKMKYNANPLECVTWRPGTCSAARPSKARKILLRVQFLHDCRHLLPEYHLLSSNCETVAVWCATGRWETLQYHHTMKWSHGASVGLLPVAPGIAGLAAGLAFWHSNQTKGQWRDTEEKLNENFKWYAMGRTPKWSFEESA